VTYVCGLSSITVAYYDLQGASLEVVTDALWTEAETEALKEARGRGETEAFENSFEARPRRGVGRRPRDRGAETEATSLEHHYCGYQQWRSITWKLNPSSAFVYIPVVLVLCNSVGIGPHNIFLSDAYN